MEKHNNLKDEKSPYLLQHATNPVNWYPWGEEALNKAKNENKMLLISIGYAACHWCHVMEKESFADDFTAKFMNDNYVCIKVDREERPDIDQIYMNAVQLISGRGGWPLNCIAMPDGRPIYGGTYFPKEQWLELLAQINEIYKVDYERIEQQANLLTKGVNSDDKLIKNRTNVVFSQKLLDSIFEGRIKDIDFTNGGEKSAPKFPLPIGYEFLLDYYETGNNTIAMNAIKITLDKMANGGIYDQIGGGFARYSVDEIWKVPHFEKMLYDNAQLIGLYSRVYAHTKTPLYKKVIENSIDFLHNNFLSQEGAYYSSFDADSEGEEGKYYVWSKNEIDNILGEDSNLYCEYYNITEAGNFENNKNILFKTIDSKHFKRAYSMSQLELDNFIKKSNNKLLLERKNRVAPALDNKILASWNALTVSGLVKAYKVLCNVDYLKQAEKTFDFLIDKMKNSNGGILRSYGSDINAFLEDYACIIEAAINLHQATLNSKYLDIAESLTQYTLQYFFSKDLNMFYYTSSEDSRLIARKIEISDNVIVSGNSQMANNLFLLGTLLNKNEYIELAQNMLKNVLDELEAGGVYYANWAILLNKIISQPYTVSVTEEKAKELEKRLREHNITNYLIRIIDEDKYKGIIVCKDKMCYPTFKDIDETITNIFYDKI
jgi:uncharacterized protein YyaL (SSP411 family)